MEIRKKISLQFTIIVGVIQLLLYFAIYISFAKSRVDQFYERLEAKATNLGQMLVDIDEINADLLRRIELNNPLSLPYERIIIYDHQNRELFSNDTGHEIQMDSTVINQVRIDDRVRGKIGHYEYLGKFYISDKDRVVVFVAAIDLNGLKKLASLRLILLLVFIIGLLIVYVAGQIFAGRAVSPINKVISQVDRIEITNLNDRLDEGSSKDEIGRLSATFNKLLERLDVSFKMQKSFIANASHEMNTPLTVITGHVEVALMKTRTEEEYIKALKKVGAESKKLNLLSRKLLLLAQASTELTSASFVSLRIDDLLWQVRRDILTNHKDFTVRIDIPNIDNEEQMLTIAGNEHLLKAAIGNIIENGCKYSNNHMVVVDLAIKANSLVIKFTDEGFGIPESELFLIFQPFYRSRTSGKIEGHGIGLSLAEKVIQLHKGTISASSEVGKGSVFTVQLPITTKDIPVII
jgi:signal transduction histidine kinase